MHIKKSDKLIILGRLSTWEDAPFDDDSYEIWGTNQLWQDFIIKEKGRADLWWEIHTLETRNPEHIEWLKECDMPIMMQDEFKEIPNSVKYPLDIIIEAFNRRYFLCTMNYQIAYAIYMGYKEIHLHGFNMIMDDDLIQRWSFEYWLGRAEQSGIKLFIPDTCDLLNSPYLYGYEANNTLAVYIQRYMNELKTKSKLNIYRSITSLQEALDALIRLDSERPKFMEEVIKRHGLQIERLSEEDYTCSY